MHTLIGHHLGIDLIVTELPELTGIAMALRPELTGIAMALKDCPDEEDLNILTDSLSAMLLL